MTNISSIHGDLSGLGGKTIRVRANETGFEAVDVADGGGGTGMSGTITFEDNKRNNHTIIISNGLIQSWTQS